MTQASSSDDEEHHHQYSLDETESVPATSSSSEKLLTLLSLSLTGDTFTSIMFQVDTAATCNTPPYHLFQKLGSTSDLCQTFSKFVSYSGEVIKPLGKISRVHGSADSYIMLDFQVVDLPNKPALLGLPDSLRLSLVTVDDARVKAQPLAPSALPHDCHSVASRLPLTKDAILSQFPSTFRSLGNIGKPVSFVMDPTVSPIQSPSYHLPVAKQEPVKAKLGEMVHAGKREEG